MPELNIGNCLLAKIGNDTVSNHKSPSFSSIDEFLISLNKLFITIAYMKNIVLVGDINIPINLEKRVTASEKYLNLAAYHGLLLSHTTITRELSKTCVDHVLVKQQKCSEHSFQNPL